MNSDELIVKWDRVNKWKFAAVLGGFQVLESSLLHPFETLKTNQQADAVRAVQSPFRTAKSLISREGVMSLYRGFWPSNIGNIPSSVFYVWVYNELRRFGQSYCDDNGYGNVAKSLVVPFFAGGAADLASLGFCSPGDVITTHMQRGFGTATYSGSFGNVVKNLYKNEGVRGFYRGFSAAVMTYTPTSAVRISISFLHG